MPLWTANGISKPTMVPKYVLKQAQTREELDGIMDVIWKANYNPYDGVAQLFFPVLGYKPEDHDASVAESKQRFWDMHQKDPSSNWFYVEEVTSGKPVGCAQWQIFAANPFTDGPPKLEASWWPEKQHKEFCELIINQIYKARANWMTRPHLALNWMAVVPEHRRRGIGNMLMKWGTDKADELGFEGWMEASSMGKLLYEKHGFQVLFKMTYDTIKPDPTDEWRRMEHELTPPPFHVMWRPANAAWKGTKMPWELGRQDAN